MRLRQVARGILGACVVLALAPASGQAAAGVATVTFTNPSGNKPLLRFTGTSISAGQTITAKISNDGRTATFTDPGIVIAAQAPQCSGTRGSATCTFGNPIYSISVGGGSGPDQVSVQTPTFVLASIDGNDGDDTLLGGAQKDTFYGGAGNDTSRGGPGADVFMADDGADVFVGGAGIDRARYGSEVGVAVSLDDVANDGIPGEGDNVRSDVEDVIAERWNYDSEGRPYPASVPGEDVFIGSAAANFLQTHDNGSRLYGLGGDDVLAWADEQYGGDGNDRLEYPDRAWGGDGDDVILHSQVAYGEAGNDLIEIDSSNELISGGDGDDQLIGYGDNTTKVHGDAGADYIEMRLRAEIFGGDGDDTVLTRDPSYPQAATVHCGPGLDVVIADQTDVVDFDCETVYRATV